MLKETDLSKLKTNSDEIYLRINFIEKLLLINKIVNRNKIETAFKPIDKLTPIKKDIKQINAILESDYSFKKKYIEISKKTDKLNENVSILLRDSKEILYELETNVFETDNEKIKRAAEEKNRYSK